jgi:hypothetical protein
VDLHRQQLWQELLDISTFVKDQQVSFLEPSKKSVSNAGESA